MIFEKPGGGRVEQAEASEVCAMEPLPGSRGLLQLVPVPSKFPCNGGKEGCTTMQVQSVGNLVANIGYKRMPRDDEWQ